VEAAADGPSQQMRLEASGYDHSQARRLTIFSQTDGQRRRATKSQGGGVDTTKPGFDSSSSIDRLQTWAAIPPHNRECGCELEGGGKGGFSINKGGWGAMTALSVPESFFVYAVFFPQFVEGVLLESRLDTVQDIKDVVLLGSEI